jgi:hypothetical protein
MHFSLSFTKRQFENAWCDSFTKKSTSKSTTATAVVVDDAEGCVVKA